MSKFPSKLLSFCLLLFFVRVGLLSAGEGIRISGAVKNEATLGAAEMAKFPVKVVKTRIGVAKNSYRGTFECEGFSLAVLLETVGVKKKVNDGFNRELDLFIKVTGRNGSTALLSYGEVFLGNRDDRAMIGMGFRFLYPHKHPDIASETWDVKALMPGNGENSEKAAKAGCMKCHIGDNPPLPLGSPQGSVSGRPALFFPKGFCLIVPDDPWPGRFVEDIVEIEIVQVEPELIKEIAGQAKETMWVENPLLVGTDGKKYPVTPELLTGMMKSDLIDCSFGLGRGFHGIHSRLGIPLAGILQKQFGALDPATIVVLGTGPDGYRSLFSGYEVFAKNNGFSLFLVEKEDNEQLKTGTGKFKLFCADDFYIDRCLRSIAEIRVISPEAVKK